MPPAPVALPALPAVCVSFPSGYDLGRAALDRSPGFSSSGSSTSMSHSDGSANVISRLRSRHGSLKTILEEATVCSTVDPSPMPAGFIGPRPAVMPPSLRVAVCDGEVRVAGSETTSCQVICCKRQDGMWSAQKRDYDEWRGETPRKSSAHRCIYKMPPAQTWLCKEDSEFTLNRIARELTVVVSTSVADFTPSVDPILKTLQSIQDNLALHWCEKYVVFDKVPLPDEIAAMQRDRDIYDNGVRGYKWSRMWGDKAEAYKIFGDELVYLKQRMHPALHKVNLVFLEEFGHLFGTVNAAFTLLSSPYVFVTQHDLEVTSAFKPSDVQLLLSALRKGVANYVLLNRDCNSSPRTARYFDFLPELSVGRANSSFPCDMTAILGFSDQAHFATVAWYKEEVLRAVVENAVGGEDRVCMEHILHERFKAEPFRRTYLYGRMDASPFIRDNVHGTWLLVDGHHQRFPSMPTRDVVVVPVESAA